MAVVATPAEKYALQWLIGRGLADEASILSLEPYYAQRGTPEKRCMGASTNMVKQLGRKGFIQNKSITRAGRRAAQ